jgi:c-di-GMP-binding flagellar brake protein YcgR
MEEYYRVVGSRTLNVGIGTNMQFQFGRRKQALKVSGMLIGIVPDEFLIIRVPAIPGILSRLETGSPILGRYVYAGNVYGFRSTMLTFIHKPTFLIFLSYPAAVETVNLRKTQRIECRFPASVKTDRGDEYKSAVVDISLGGCRISVDNDQTGPSSFDVDQKIELSFHLAGIAEEQVIDGRVQNIKKDGQFTEMGIQFDQGNEAILNNVKLFINNFTTLPSLPPD